ncbi:DNA-3-methyladenine glycosylase [Eubacteriales bacterium OttesenSCG-928-M02]|nr:DNA-3-methyladenine glycosylase [Eubacteriales bacterium OttesenSCG-928-M02]
MKLMREDYTVGALELAERLIGCTLVSNIDGVRTGGIINETEAYLGKEDRAAHVYRGRPEGRVRVIYGPGGFAYVYMVYGMHNCLNVVAEKEGVPHCVLIRGIHPTIGVDTMLERRGRKDGKGLTDGPGKLGQALGITRAHYGTDLTGELLYIEAGERVPVYATKRIGVDYAGEDAELLYRFTPQTPF